MDFDEWWDKNHKYDIDPTRKDLAREAWMAGQLNMVEGYIKEEKKDGNK